MTNITTTTLQRFWVIQVRTGEYSDQDCCVMQTGFRTEAAAQREADRLEALTRKWREKRPAPSSDYGDTWVKAIRAWKEGYQAEVPEWAFSTEAVATFEVYEIELADGP